MSRFFIVNPAAGRGRAKRLLSEISERFPEATNSAVGFTQCRGDEDRLTERALALGAHTIVAIGGDGTCSAIANAMLRRNTSAKLAVVPCGTGNDFAKALGVQNLSIAESSKLLSSGAARSIDVGRVDGHFFLNSCGFGFDAAVLEASYNVRLLRGDAVYIYSALRQLFTFRGLDVGTGNPLGRTREKLLMVTALNGQWLGGAFRIAPEASMTDGELDIGFFTDCGVIERARLFAGALRGTHVSLPTVRTLKTRSITLEFSAKPAMEMDGELRHATSRTVTIECLPRALSVVAAPGAL